MSEYLSLKFQHECHDCVGHMRLCTVVEQNDPTCELAWSFRFDCLAKGGQGLREMLGIHCCPALQEVYQKGPSWSKKNVSIIFPALVWMALNFFVVVTLDASRFFVSILVRSDDTKTHLQPPLVPGTHSLPGIALQMINKVGGSRSPSIQTRPLSLRLCHFWSPKKDSEGQTIHLE